MSGAQGTAEPATRREGRAAPVSALAGGLVTFVTLFLPLAPVVGGAVAGYLRAGDARAGANVGGGAGAVALCLLVGAASGLFALFPAPISGTLPEPLGVVLGVGGVVLGAYVLVLSTLGGVCGSFAASEADILGRWRG